MPEAPSPETYGGKLGGRVASLAHRAVLLGTQQALPLRRGLAAVVLEDFFDKVSGEIRGTIGPILAPLVEHPELPDGLRPALSFIARGSGQWQTFLGQTVAGSALSVGLGAFLSNELQPVTGRLIATNPHMPMSIGDAARAVATRLDDGTTAAFDAAQQGLSDHRFRILVNLARARLTPDQAIDLLHRGAISEGEVRNTLAALGYEDRSINQILGGVDMLLSPQELASLVTFGVLDVGTAKAAARKAGMAADNFQYLVDGNGQPPSTQELLFAYRRGVIGRDRLFRGVQQGPLRNEWFDVVESFGIVPMSTADAIQASVQNHLSKAQAQAIAHQNGLEPAHFDALYETAGSPPGPHEMLEFLNRGLVSEAEVTQALSESRLKNKYINLFLQARHRLPTMEQTLSMVRKAVITPDRGKQLLSQLGFLPDIADVLIASAKTAPTTAGKDLSTSQVRQLYHDRVLSRGQALTMLAHLGYDATESATLLDLTDIARRSRLTSALVTRVHHAYVMRLMTRTEASSALDQAGIDATTRDEDLDVWDVERTTVRRTLTEAQVVSALKKGVIDETSARDRLSAMGYSDDDAGVLLAVAGTGRTPRQSAP